MSEQKGDPCDDCKWSGWPCVLCNDHMYHGRLPCPYRRCKYGTPTPDYRVINYVPAKVVSSALDPPKEDLLALSPKQRYVRKSVRLGSGDLGGYVKAWYWHLESTDNAEKKGLQS